MLEQERDIGRMREQVGAGQRMSLYLPDWFGDIFDSDLLRDRAVTLGRLQAVLALVHLGVSFAQIFLLSLPEVRADERLRLGCAAAVGVLAALSGAVGGLLLVEPATRLHLLVRLWSFAALSEQLYASAEQEQRLRDACSAPNWGDPLDCSAELARQQARVALAGLGLLLCVGGAYLALEHSDALSDQADQSEMEQALEQAGYKLPWQLSSAVQTPAEPAEPPAAFGPKTPPLMSDGLGRSPSQQGDDILPQSAGLPISAGAGPAADATSLDRDAELLE